MNGTPRPPVVLVHGAWHGGWCYGRVAERLRSAGHRVFTPTLTGLGERSHLLSSTVNLSTHVADIVNVIRWGELRHVVLVGHSYGGVVVTAVADALAETISALVYLDAFIPTDGKSFHDIVPRELAQAQVESAVPSGGLSVPPIPAAAFNVNDADRAWVDSLCTAHPLRTLTQPVALRGRHTGIAAKTYVLATRNPLPLFGAFAEAVRRDPTWSSHELACGHDVMIDLPQETAQIIEQAAGRGPFH